MDAVRESFVFLWTGHYGSGKTLMAVSYKPKGIANPNRLMIDAEGRSIRYNSEHHGVTGDKPEALLYSFTMFPNAMDEISEEDFLVLLRVIAGREKLASGKPDVILFDNFALFQGALEGWCQDAASAGKIIDALNLRSRYDSFLKFRFKVDPGWWRMVKDIIREFFRACKRAGIDVVITTEQKNEWENYGVRGNGPDGKPLQRIVGTTAKVHDVVFQMSDTCWLLSRNAEVLTSAPTVSLDPLNPKMSIVGLPPKFKFTTWDRIWELEAQRGLADDKALAEVKRPEPQFRETEGQSTEPQEDPIDAGRRRFVEELMAGNPDMFPNRPAVAKYMQAQKMVYTLDKHDELRAMALGEKVQA